MPYDLDFRMPFDPVIERPAEAEPLRPETVVEIRQRRLAVERQRYNEGQKFRVSSAQIADEGITYKPTIINRDDDFKRELPLLVAARLKSATAAERKMLADFVANAEALAALTRHGVLPPGLVAHFSHPLRGGGKAGPKNICIMTTDARAMLKTTRVAPRIMNVYGMTMDEIQQRAARYLLSPAQSIPAHFIKPVMIGFPHGCVALNEDDLRLRDHAAYIAAETAAIDALKRIAGPRERPGHRSQRQARGPRR